MAAGKRKKVYVFKPVGLDLWDPKPHLPEPGAKVILTEPHGCPKNGTMGFFYVKGAESGEFHGLVCKGSLTATKEYAVERDLAAEARDALSAARRARYA